MLSRGIILFLVATATGENLLPKAHIHFRRFINDFGRQYADDNETRMRFEIFKRTLQKIDELNAANDHAIFGITKWSDLTDEEKRNQFGGISKNFGDNLNGICTNITKVSNSGAPKEWDWTEHQAVTNVKYQGSCMSCWAFSAIGAVEGQYAIKHKELLAFSEQQLVSCDHNNSYDAGCGGGRMTTAFSYIIQSGGIMSEKDYPYEERNGTCKFDQSKVKAKFSSCNYYTLQSEETLKELLYSKGPLSVAINANDIEQYQNGIVTNCHGYDEANHGVLLVGYGEENGVPFWRFKNSYGRDFGEKGYFRLKIGTDQCGMMKNLITSISY